MATLRRVTFIHLGLCALLVLQQPSVVVRAVAWQQDRTLTDSSQGAPGGVAEEEKLPGLRASGQCRPLAGAHGGPGLTAPRVRVWCEPRAPDERVHALARSHWRSILLPPWGAADDDPPEPV